MSFTSNGGVGSTPTPLFVSFSMTGYPDIPFVLLANVIIL